MSMLKQLLFRQFILAAGLLLCGGLAASPALAGSITYNFSGSVTAVDSLVSSQFNNSMTMSGTMRINQADQDPGSSSTGIYGVEAFTVTIGGYTATAGLSPENNTIVLNIPVVGDGFFSIMDQINGPNVNFLGPRNFTMGLFGPSGLWGSGDALPTSVPSVSSFGSINEFRLAFGPTGVPGAVSGVITSLTAVPLPAGVVLFGIGLISLVGLGAGGLRNLRGSQA